MNNIKKHIQIKVLWAVSLCFSLGWNYAQTTNQGILYVSSDTQFSTLGDLENTTSGEFYNDGEAFIYAGFNNEGVVDFYLETGLTRFIGTQPQQISGSAESYFYNLYFENTSAEAPFHLSGAISASGEVDFREGIVDNDNHSGSFTFTSNAVHVNTSDFSHVDGPVVKTGDTRFVYPIGDGGYYRFAEMSPPESASAVFEGKYYFQNSNDRYSHTSRQDIIGHIDDAEYWTVEKTTESEDVFISLSWRDVTTPEMFIDAAQNNLLHIVRWDEDNGQWIDEGGTTDLGDKVVTSPVSGYGVFTFGIIREEAPEEDGVVIYNGVSPNGDGMNDFFYIKGIEKYPDNTLEVYNRWGVKVFGTEGYGVNGNWFRGYSEGRATVNEGKRLPTGTYFYILKYINENGNREDRSGYLYIN